VCVCVISTKDSLQAFTCIQLHRNHCRAQFKDQTWLLRTSRRVRRTRRRWPVDEHAVVGTYLLTWERFGEANENKDNLIIWRLETGDRYRGYCELWIIYRCGVLRVAAFTQKQYAKENWPLMQW
jgi:hypothetical protein